MYINIDILKREIELLPPPERACERRCLMIPNRLDELKTEGLVTRCTIKPDDVIRYDEITVIAIRYCRSKNDCWLEWELEL